MSAAVDNLESLDNKTLREQCLKYGLPNIPITDTSRKLLIKRLRIAMEGGTKSPEKQKSRRETIHVIKVNKEISNEEDTPKTPVKSKVIGRKTIGTPILPPHEPSEPARATVTQRRRSGRTTPISQLEPIAPHSVKRKAADIIQEDDEDSIQIPVIVEKSTEPSRQGRAPSLSKSVVVTTSYVKDSPKEIIELDDTDPEEVDEEEYEEEEEEEEEELQLEPGIEPVIYKYVSSSRQYDTSKPFSLPLERGPVINYPVSRISQETSRISLGKSPIKTASYETSATRRYTTGGYKVISDGSENRTFAHHSEEFNETKEDNMEAPYLSDFARRLSRLKAEPITTGISSPLKSEAPLRETSHYYTTSVSGRRGISYNESIGESFNKFLIALDRKYHLKRNLIIFAIILTIILVYVLLF